MSELKDRIKEAAEEVGGLNKLSDMIETARRTVGNWVDGSSEPKSSALAQIAIATGVSVRWLVLNIGPKFEDEAYSTLAAGVAKDKLIERSLGVPDIKAIGFSEQAPRIVSDLLIRIHTLLKRTHQDAGLRVPEDQLLRLATAAYNDFVADGVDPEDVAELDARLTLLQKKFERQIEAAKAAPGTGKRSAS